ncbi:hypothetical protein ACOZ4N_11005 [Halorientalis pallida]|uniref:hypothetical protein n=1 Tax=Halorientalis pallida TaxID=2479928 RepID=UPI003C6FDF9C
MPTAPSLAHWQTWSNVGAVSVFVFVLSLYTRDLLVGPLESVGIPFGLFSGFFLGLAVLSVFQFLFHLTGEDIADEQ